MGGALLDFSNQYRAVLFKIGDATVYLTDTLISTWVVMGLLFLFTAVVCIKMRRFTDVPSTRFQSLMEIMIEQIDNLGDSMMGPQLKGFNGFFFGIFAFILTSNYIGMVGLRPPTADLATTLALALTIFALIHISGAVRQKGRYFKSFFEPNPIFFPINLVGELSKPISLGFRLFGNVLGGLIIMGMIYSMLPTVLSFVLPSVLHVYFDVLVGALQAYIFTVLSMTFIKQKAVADE